MKNDCNRSTLSPRTAAPRTDVYETADSLILVADVPGADQDSIELSLAEDVLTLRARPVSSVPEGWRACGAEFELLHYERRLRLTAPVDPEGIHAELTNGRLRVTMKKLAPRAQRIPVRAG